MCTLIALHRCAPDPSRPYLVVAANRDEFLNRPTEEPALRTWRGKRILSPLDKEAGGTWWGLNEDGLFAAITNRPCTSPDATRRSRGLLVLDALTHASADKAADALSALPAGEYNPFNLFVADAFRAFALVYQESGERWDLEPGVHVIGNADPDTEDVEKVRRVLERARSVHQSGVDDKLDALAGLCASHDGDPDPVASPCVHWDHYGTRSSTLLELGPDNGILRHASGAPCTVPYEDLSPLLHQLKPELAGIGATSTQKSTDTRKAS